MKHRTRLLFATLGLIGIMGAVMSFVSMNRDETTTLGKAPPRTEVSAQDDLVSESIPRNDATGPSETPILAEEKADGDDRRLPEASISPDGLRVEFMPVDGSEVAEELRFQITDLFGDGAISGRTDLRGIARLAAVPEWPALRVLLNSERWHLVCPDDPYGSPTWSTPHAIQNPGDRFVRVPISPGTSVSGRVLASESGQGLPGVVVTCFGLNLGPLDRGTKKATTDQEGRFLIDRIPGGWSSLRCDLEGRGLDVELLSKTLRTASPFDVLPTSSLPEQGDAPRLKLLPDGAGLTFYASDARPARDIVIRLGRNGSVEGRVVDEGGAGVEGVEVGLLRERQVFRLRAANELQESGYVTSGADGRFSFSSVASGRYRVATAPSARHPFAESEVFAVRSAAATTGLKLVVQDERFVDVQIVTRAGEPLAGLELEARERGKGVNITMYLIDSATSDGEGRATLGRFGRGRYRIHLPDLNARGLLLEDPETLGVTEDELARGQKRIVLIEALSLRGSLVGPEGAPLVRGLVSFQKLSSAGDWENLPFADCTTDAEGRFERLVPEGGSYRIRMVSKPGGGGSLDFRPRHEVVFGPGQEVGPIACRRDER